MEFMLPTLVDVLGFAAHQKYVLLDPKASILEIVMPLTARERGFFPTVPQVSVIESRFNTHSEAIVQCFRRSVMLRCLHEGNERFVRFHASSHDMREALWSDHRRVEVPAWSAVKGSCHLTEVMGVTMRVWKRPTVSELPRIRSAK